MAEEIATPLSKRLFRKEMRGIQGLCRGTLKKISRHALDGNFAARSNRDSTFVVAVLTPFTGGIRQFLPGDNQARGSR